MDEVGELPLSLQVKLLRVIQEHEVMRVGGRKPIPIDIRIISGTHVDLKRAVSENKFRLDLYYRLNQK
ncbi:Propionate catabolism operon regulatory protein [compost metagenome]